LAGPATPLPRILPARSADRRVRVHRLLLRPPADLRSARALRSPPHLQHQIRDPRSSLAQFEVLLDGSIRRKRNTEASKSDRNAYRRDRHRPCRRAHRLDPIHPDATFHLKALR